MGNVYEACQKATFNGDALQRVHGTDQIYSRPVSWTQEVCAEGDTQESAVANLKKVIEGLCSSSSGNFECRKAESIGTPKVEKSFSILRWLFETMASTKFKDPFFL